MMMTMHVMPRWMQLALKRRMVGITLPPFGIYLRPGHEDNAILKAHETIHWAQYERMGFLMFYTSYLWGLVRYGYQDHPMEVEARRGAKTP